MTCVRIWTTSCVRSCGSGECSSVRISTVKARALATNWRRFSTWWRKRPRTTTSVAKNGWQAQAHRPDADASAAGNHGFAEGLDEVDGSLRTRPVGLRDGGGGSVGAQLVEHVAGTLQ